MEIANNEWIKKIVWIDKTKQNEDSFLGELLNGGKAAMLNCVPWNLYLSCICRLRNFGDKKYVENNYVLFEIKNGDVSIIAETQTGTMITDIEDKKRISYLQKEAEKFLNQYYD